MVLVSLVGEQPLPILLPTRALRPTRVALIHTVDTLSVAKRVRRLLDMVVDFVRVEPFDVRDCQRKIKQYLKRVRGTAVYNLTGGTKTMLLAAFMSALHRKERVLYLQTHGSVSRLYHYRYSSSGLIETKTEDLPALITADDYLRAHLPGYKAVGFSRGEKRGREFEEAVYQALKGNADEILIGVKPGGVADNIDVDLFIRCGNQAGIAELKLSKGNKDGIDQLSTAGGQAYLGIYTQKFLIVGREVTAGIKQLAQARGISVIELPSYANGQLSYADRRKLVVTVQAKLIAQKPM